MNLETRLPHRLALACALWQLAATPRVLTPEFPAEDELADVEHAVELAAYCSLAWREAGAPNGWGKETIADLAAEDQAGALRELLESPALRAEVRGFVEGALAVMGLGHEHVASVRAFGPGWRDLPAVSLRASAP